MNDLVIAHSVGAELQGSGQVDSIVYAIHGMRLSTTSFEYTIAPYPVFIDGEWQVVLKSVTQTVPYPAGNRGSLVGMGPCSEKQLHVNWEWSEGKHSDWFDRVKAIAEYSESDWVKIYSDRGTTQYEGVHDPYARMLIANKSKRRIAGFMNVYELPFAKPEGGQVNIATLLWIRMVLEAGEGSSDPTPAGTKQIAYGGIARDDRPQPIVLFN